MGSSWSSAARARWCSPTSAARWRVAAIRSSPRRATSSTIARHSGRVLAGRLTLGRHPTLAPYLLPRVLPDLQRSSPTCRSSCARRQTKVLLGELARGVLDVVMLALPVPEADVETMRLFDDPFLLAVPAADRSPHQRPCHRARHRPAPAHSAGGRPLSARSGAGLSAPMRSATPWVLAPPVSRQ